MISPVDIVEKSIISYLIYCITIPYFIAIFITNKINYFLIAFEALRLHL